MLRTRLEQIVADHHGHVELKKPFTSRPPLLVVFSPAARTWPCMSFCGVTVARGARSEPHTSSVIVTEVALGKFHQSWSEELSTTVGGATLTAPASVTVTTTSPEPLMVRLLIALSSLAVTL